MTVRKHHFVLFIIVVGFLALNILNLSNLSLIDWDEGVFALQGKWLATNFTAGKPFNFQTPPLFPMLVALGFKIFNFADWVLPLASVIFSSATLVFIYQFARALYDDKIAMYSVVLFGLTEYFLFFSRSGLSDAAFGGCFVSGMYFFYHGFAHRKNISLILAGTCALLALYLKYTGVLLLAVFFAQGLLLYKRLIHRWFLFTVIGPLILFLPYLILFLKIVSLPGISERHGSLLGLNHLKFIVYLVLFAPVPFFLSILSIVRNTRFVPGGEKDAVRRKSAVLYLPLLIYFVILGFYFPYFRLAYPMVMILSILAAGLIAETKKVKYPVLFGCSVLALCLGRTTMAYHSRVPAEIGRRAQIAADSAKVNYLLASVPPNVAFYLKGITYIPANNRLKKIPALFKKQQVIWPDSNLFLGQSQIMFLYSTIAERYRDHYRLFFRHATEIDSFEFIDAPVYYQDPNNDLRETRQVYHLFAIDLSELDSNGLTEIWKLVFRAEMDLYNITVPSR